MTDVEAAVIIALKKNHSAENDDYKQVTKSIKSIGA